jgi:hypothetical protein
MYLHVWGLTEKDADRAHDDAKAKLRGQLNDEKNVQVIQTVGNPCPIGRRDPDAIAQDASHHMAWALYESDETNEGSQP